jgi:Tol biopolymer transport system component
MLAAVIRPDATRLVPAEAPAGALEAGVGAVLASRDAAGTVRVLVVNRAGSARRLKLAGGPVPSAVTVFDDPKSAPRSVGPSSVVSVPPRSLVLIEVPSGLGPRASFLDPFPKPHRSRVVSDAQIVFEAPGVPGDGSKQELFTMNLDGSNRTQLTSDGLSKFLPHFSPDATRLVYTKFYVGQYGSADQVTDVAVYDFGSAAETRLTHTGTGYQPAWSPDGGRIAFGSFLGDGIWIMNADGSGRRLIAIPSGTDDDRQWGDPAWSSDDWILFTVAQFTGGCFKVRLDKMRPDGSLRTKVTDGGSDCTPPGKEQSGDSDPGFSADGKTIFSSRGFSNAPPGFPGNVERRLFSISSDAWTPGKVERDLSLPSNPSCIEGVPKGSPDGTRILLFRACAGEPHIGVTLTDTAGTYRTWITEGFGADWNPVAKN